MHPVEPPYSTIRRFPGPAAFAHLNTAEPAQSGFTSPDVEPWQFPLGALHGAQVGLEALKEFMTRTHLLSCTCGQRGRSPPRGATEIVLLLAAAQPGFALATA